MNDFELDIRKIREEAREKMADGPITSSYGHDRKRVVAVLNEMLATELVCALRYRSHYHAATGLRAESVANEFLEHAQEEEAHAHSLASRISQLRGVPNLDPNGLGARAHSEYAPASSLKAMLQENLVAERIAIETYTRAIRWIGDGDSTTRRILEDILAVEEGHADELAGLLNAS